MKKDVAPDAFCMDEETPLVEEEEEEEEEEAAVDAQGIMEGGAARQGPSWLEPLCRQGVRLTLEVPAEALAVMAVTRGASEAVTPLSAAATPITP